MNTEKKSCNIIKYRTERIYVRRKFRIIIFQSLKTKIIQDSVVNTKTKGILFLTENLIKNITVSEFIICLLN